MDELQNKNPKISLILYAENISQVFYRDCLESIVSNLYYYSNIEVIILDACAVDYVDESPALADTNDPVKRFALSRRPKMASEFFPENSSIVKYNRIRSGQSRGYVLNNAYNYCSGEVLFFLHKCPRLSTSAVFSVAQAYSEGAEFIYCDNNDIEGLERTNPQLKPDKNIELIRHRNYIGDTFAISAKSFKKIGGFRDILNMSAEYDLILRVFEKHLDIVHIKKQLYSKRITDTKRTAAYTGIKLLNEYSVVVDAHLKRQGVSARVVPNFKKDFLEILYDGNGYRSHRKDYLLIRAPGVHVSLKSALPKMFGHLRQPDVGMVGVCFMKNPLYYDNCGYIFDKQGLAYPVGKGQNILFEGLGLRCIIPQDVSMVDLGFCLIKKRLYKRIGGFDRMMANRDMALDFCMKVRSLGYRIVYEPAVRAYRSRSEHETNEDSHARLMRRWAEVIEMGDPNYLSDLPPGLNNYVDYEVN